MSNLKETIEESYHLGSLNAIKSIRSLLNGLSKALAFRGQTMSLDDINNAIDRFREAIEKNRTT
jgi:hypothetical protein